MSDYSFIFSIIYLFIIQLFIYFFLFIYLFISFWKEDVARVFGWVRSLTSNSKLNASDMSWNPDTNNDSLDLHIPMAMSVMRLFIITLQTFFRPLKGCRGRDRMIIGFETTSSITTEVVSSNPAHGEVYSIRHYGIKFVRKPTVTI